MIPRSLIVVLLFSASILVTPSYSNGDMVTLIPEGGFATGANHNALAGPLTASDLSSIDILGSGMTVAEAMADGNFATHIATVETDFSGGGVGFFDSGYDSLSRTEMLTHRASAESIFHFSVDVPTMFDIAGFIDVMDGFGTTVPGNVELEIELLEFDMFGMPASTVFYNYQVSKSTIDQGFVVGGMDGDTTNVLVGVASGLLDPTKVYRYRTLVTTNAIDDGVSMLPTDGTATLSGAHTIVFAAESVPEPATAGFVGLMFLATSLRRRRA